MRWFFTLYFLFFTLNITAQNLVPNYSFEDTISCPNNTDELYKLKFWFNPTKSSPDYYNMCSSSGIVGVPTNILGYQNPKQGNGYAGFGLFIPPGTSNYREYISIRLIDSLIANKKYCMSFYISLINSAKYAIDDISLYFSKDSIKSTTTKNLPFTPQMKNVDGNFLSDTLNWMLISDTLIAQGGERFITIGNFNPDSTTSLLDIGGNGSSYYYIDDVSVIPCDSGVGIRELTDGEEIFKLYPNPNDGNMQLDYTMEKSQEGWFIIFDIAGKTINKYDLKEGYNTLSVSEGALRNGIYFYKIIIDNKFIVSEMLIIIKQ